MRALIAPLLVAPLMTFAQDVRAPDASLAAAEGSWKGALIYADYAKPGREVTLPTRLQVVLGDTAELVLHFTYDDGPGKVVHSYERLRFDSTVKRLTWYSTAREPIEWTLVEDTMEPSRRRIVAERETAKGRDRQSFSFARDELTFGKEELVGGAPPLQRNRYRFTRE